MTALQPLREFGLQSERDDRSPAGLNYYWKSHFLKEISDDAIDVMVSHFATAPSPRCAVGFQQYGGAVSRVGRTETAFSHRDARYDFIPTSIWSDPRESETLMQWSRDLWEMMKPFSTGGEYVNNCCQSAKVGQIGTREDYCYEELRVSSLRVLL